MTYEVITPERQLSLKRHFIGFYIWHWYCVFCLITDTIVLFMFCNILVTYWLYSSCYNKSNLEFNVETLVMYCLNPSFGQIFYLMLISLLIIRRELLQWGLHLILLAEASWVQQVSHGSEQIIIRGEIFSGKTSVQLVVVKRGPAHRTCHQTWIFQTQGDGIHKVESRWGNIFRVRYSLLSNFANL